jgi:hypothetical protein
MRTSLRASSPNLGIEVHLNLKNRGGLTMMENKFESRELFSHATVRHDTTRLVTQACQSPRDNSDYSGKSKPWGTGVRQDCYC